MKNNEVYICDTGHKEYLQEEFNPSVEYPEGINITLKSDKQIYDSFRKLMYEMGFDKENYNKSNWNPFSEFIKKGDKVLIKPNLVNHKNAIAENGTDCLITNFSVIRPIIDYTIIALNGTGKIIVGDAPVQDCNFSEVIKLYNLIDSIKEYNNKGINIDLKDFRKNENPDIETILVNLGNDSSLSETDEYSKKYGITNYDLREMHKHHHKGNHEYLIAKDILDADVVINVPKPKSHRKAGMTACMKNFIGINSKKEYLPHHRNGSVASNGDEYPEKSVIKKLWSITKNYTYTKNKLIMFIFKVLGYSQAAIKKNRYREGSWYGNDTIWRTILDINKIVLYANKKGEMKNEKQRIVFNVADMIVCGEKEGPLLPSPKEVGYLVAGFNQLQMDSAIAKIMGFDKDKIKYIKNGYELKKYKISFNKECKIIKNGKIIDENQINNHFNASDGWKDYLQCEEEIK